LAAVRGTTGVIRLNFGDARVGDVKVGAAKAGNAATDAGTGTIGAKEMIAVDGAGAIRAAETKAAVNFTAAVDASSTVEEGGRKRWR
jgi:hypothetical protein